LYDARSLFWVLIIHDLATLFPGAIVHR